MKRDVCPPIRIGKRSLARARSLQQGKCAMTGDDDRLRHGERPRTSLPVEYAHEERGLASWAPRPVWGNLDDPCFDLDFYQPYLACVAPQAMRQVCVGAG